MTVRADFADLRLAGASSATVFTRARGELIVSRIDRRPKASATSLDCCLSQSISDGVKGWLTTKDTAFEFGEVLKPVTELSLPEGLKLAAMTPY